MIPFLPEKYRELARMHEAATPGEWFSHDMAGRFVESAESDIATTIYPPNAAFIVAARNLTPSLLQDLAAALGRIAELEGAIDEARNIASETMERMNADSDEGSWFLVRLTKLMEALEVLANPKKG